MRRAWGVMALVGMATGCSVDEGLAPRRMLPRVGGSITVVPKASAYKPTVVPTLGRFEDVNENNLIVGTANGTAVFMQLGGPVINMNKGTGVASEAYAVNLAAQIVGAVNLGSPGAPPLSPAFWPQPSAVPVILPESGDAVDINDQGLAVGTIERKGKRRAFIWDHSRSGQVTILPLLPGGSSSAARAVNNDRLILGVADDGATEHTVVWQFKGTRWTVQPVSGIDGRDLDAGLGIVGSSGGRASYGTPNFVGLLNTVGPSDAWAASVNGFVVGEDNGTSPGWPQVNEAYIADRAGTTTYLPLPTSSMWRATFARGVNSCGVVVGGVWPFPGGTFTDSPAVWDPGC